LNFHQSFPLPSYTTGLFAFVFDIQEAKTICQSFPPLSRDRLAGFWKRTASSGITRRAAISFSTIPFRVAERWCRNTTATYQRER
jgi:hypothetical protein